MKKNILMGLTVLMLLCGCKKEDTDSKFSTVDGESESVSSSESVTTEVPIVIEPKEIFNLLGEKYKEYEVVQNNPLVVKVMARSEEDETANAFAHFSKDGLLVKYLDKWYEIVPKSVYKLSDDIFFSYNEFSFRNMDQPIIWDMRINWTDLYSIDEDSEERVQKKLIEIPYFKKVTMDWIKYENDGIVMNIKYKMLDENIGFEIMGYAMLGENFAIWFEYSEFLNDSSQMEMPDIESEDFLKSIFFVREYK